MGYDTDHDGTHRDVKAAAEARRKPNQWSRTHRPIEADAEELGLTGEIEFARLIGRPGHKPRTARAGAAYQFEIAGLKVKTTTSHRLKLNVKADRRLEADLYVLMCVPKGDRNAFLAGYATRDEVAAAPVNDQVQGRGGYITPFHSIGYGEGLHPARDLFPLLGKPLPPYMTKPAAVRPRDRDFRTRPGYPDDSAAMIRECMDAAE